MNKKTTVQACPVLVRVSEPGSNTGMHAELAICKCREREHVHVSSLSFFFYKENAGFWEQGNNQKQLHTYYIWSHSCLCDVMTNINKWMKKGAGKRQRKGWGDDWALMMPAAAMLSAGRRSSQAASWEPAADERWGEWWGRPRQKAHKKSHRSQLSEYYTVLDSFSLSHSSLFLT